MSTGGAPDPYKPVDPNGLQTMSTAAGALSFGAFAASGASATVASALGLGTPSAKIVAAGLSLQSLGRLSLFAVGLLLLAAAILLNIASLIRRRQLSEEYDKELAVYKEEVKKTEEAKGREHSENHY